MKLLPVLYLLLTFLVIAPSLSAQSSTDADERRAKLLKQGYRDFTSADGSQKLFAKLTDVDREMKAISLLNEQGKPMNNVAVAAFSKEDQAYIKAWAAEDLFAAEGALEAQIKRTRGSDAGTVENPYLAWAIRSYGDDFKIKTGHEGFDIQVRSAREHPLEGARVEYRLFVVYDPPNAEKKKRDIEAVVHPGEMALPRISPRGLIEVQTATVTLAEIKMPSGMVWTDGGRRDFEDKLDGVWIRIYKNDTLLLEQSVPESLKDNEVW